jgi:DNA-binding SARP family transcriptional activator
MAGGLVRARQEVNYGHRARHAAGASRYHGAHRASQRRDLLSDVFELFPYGIAVADATGSIFVWNRAFAHLTGMGADAGRMRCCELFGCRTPGGSLEDVCLAEAAIDAGDALPEVRVDLPGAGRSLWVTAAPLRLDASRLVFQIRPVEAGDAGSPNARGDGGPPWLQIFTLGRTRVETPQGSLPGEWLEQRAGQLLKFLVCERHRVVATEEIAEALWPNPRTATLNTVRHFVHALRERLEPARPRHARSALVVARRGGYTLNRENVWVDADEFEARVTSGLAAFADGKRGLAADALERALTLYRGDFLADDPYAEWAFSERERLRSLIEKPLRALSELHAGDLDAAAGYLERLAEMEPFDQEVQRQLLTLWIQQGRLSRAVRHYHTFELRLLREFDEPPEFRLSELAVSRP